MSTFVDDLARDIASRLHVSSPYAKPVASMDYGRNHLCLPSDDEDEEGDEVGDNEEDDEEEEEQNKKEEEAYLQKKTRNRNNGKPTFETGPLNKNATELRTTLSAKKHGLVHKAPALYNDITQDGNKDVGGLAAVRTHMRRAHKMSDIASHCGRSVPLRPHTSHGTRRKETHRTLQRPNCYDRSTHSCPGDMTTTHSLMVNKTTRMLSSSASLDDLCRLGQRQASHHNLSKHNHHRQQLAKGASTLGSARSPLPPGIDFLVQVEQQNADRSLRSRKPVDLSGTHLHGLLGRLPEPGSRTINFQHATARTTPRSRSCSNISLASSPNRNDMPLLQGSSSGRPPTGTSLPKMVVSPVNPGSTATTMRNLSPAHKKVDHKGTRHVQRSRPPTPLLPKIPSGYLSLSFQSNGSSMLPMQPVVPSAKFEAPPTSSRFQRSDTLSATAAVRSAERVGVRP